MKYFALLFVIFWLSASAFSQDSLNIRRIGSVGLSRGFLNGVAVQGDYAFAGTGGDSTVEGLWVVDVSNPAHPDSAAFDTVSTIWGALGIAVSDSLCAIASAAGQVDLYDIRNPRLPEHLSNIGEGDGLVWDVALQGNYLYAVRYVPRGLFTANIADPRHPQLVGFLPFADDPSGLCLAGDYAYVAASGGLHVVDVHDPALPIEVAVVPDSDAIHVAVLDGYAYVTLFGGAFSVIDVSEPRAAHHVTYVITHGYSDGIAAVGHHVMVPAGDEGLLVYDVTDPTQPVLSGYHRSAAWTGEVAMSGPYAFVTSYRRLDVYDCSAALDAADRGFVLHPSAFSLSCAPNPFNPVTTISFSLPKASAVKVTVFDISGRLVETLADQRMNAGEHRLWMEGSMLPSGIYFVRLEAGEHTDTQKLLLIK
ncbi:MAG TPA: T9SS type A sorting domain-containing protein [bacterium]|jgi:hypothetical protein